MRKAISPTTAQAEAMKKAGIHLPFLGMAIGVYTRQFLAENIITGEVKSIGRE